MPICVDLLPPALAPLNLVVGEITSFDLRIRNNSNSPLTVRLVDETLQRKRRRRKELERKRIWKAEREERAKRREEMRKDEEAEPEEEEEAAGEVEEEGERAPEVAEELSKSVVGPDDDIFLVVSARLYKRVCPSVGRSVRRSV